MPRWKPCTRGYNGRQEARRETCSGRVEPWDRHQATHESDEAE